MFDPGIRMPISFDNMGKLMQNDVRLKSFYEVMGKLVVLVQASHSPAQVKKIKKRHSKGEELRKLLLGKSTTKFEEPVSFGTGVFVEKGGYILTCAHVIAEYATVKVRTLDGEMFYEVKCVYKDMQQNLALLCLCDPLYDQRYDEGYVNLAATDSVNVGMQVLCIDNSYKLPFSVSVGQVAYPCNEIENIDLQVTALARTRGCRLLGDLKVYIDTDFILSQCDCRLRLIEVLNVHGGKGGFGAPYFDSSGCLIGIFLMSFGIVDYGIHVYHIKSFMDKVSLEGKGAKGKVAAKRNGREKDYESIHKKRVKKKFKI